MAEKITVPPELPVLPVRDMVLFPGGVLPLTIGRESSLALLNALEGEEKLLAVVSQLDPRVEEPTDVDLHRVGTMAKLHKTVKLPNGNLVVFVEGIERIRLLGLLSRSRFCALAWSRWPIRLGRATPNCLPWSATHGSCFATSWHGHRNCLTTCKPWR